MKGTVDATFCDRSFLHSHRITSPSRVRDMKFTEAALNFSDKVLYSSKCSTLYFQK